MVCNCTLHNIGCVCCALKNVLYPGQYLTTWYSITRYRAVPGPLPSVQCAACSAERERGPLEEPDGAAATDQPLAGPGHSRFHTVQCTHCTAQWLLSVSTHVHCSTHSYSLTAKLILFDKSTLFTFYVYTRLHYKLSFQVLAL